MCNNVKWNRLNKKKKEVVVKDKISDWIENRPKLSRNVRAIENKILKGNSIEYVKGSPLKLHDGTRIYKISEKVIRGGFKEIIIEFSFKSTNSRKITSFKRYRNDNLLEIEKFLENSQSIYQTRNIDLKYTLNQIA